MLLCQNFSKQKQLPRQQVMCPFNAAKCKKWFLAYRISELNV